MPESAPLHPEPHLLARRGYATRSQIRGKSRGQWAKPPGPSGWVLVLDTETGIDAAQQLRVGGYQLRHEGELHEEGMFYDPESLTDAERSVLYGYCAKKNLEVRVVADFIDSVIFAVAYELDAVIVGFNLPFDLSRIAIAHSTARRMEGAFSLQLSQDRRKPRVQVKHLSRTTSLMQFTAPPKQETPRGMRRRGLRVATRRGHFVDVKTLGAAVSGLRGSLENYANKLGVTRKLHVDNYGTEWSVDLSDYLRADVQVTWECYRKLEERYRSFGLSKPISAIHSEASIGKACLAEMNIRPALELQRVLPPWITAAAMNSYFGGRSEVHIRRRPVRVMHCDFLSMYSTVSALMGLFQFRNR